MGIEADTGRGLPAGRHATVDADGTFTTEIVPTTTATYRAVVGGEASPAVQLLVLDRKLAASRGGKGRRVTVSARVAPASQGAPVVLQLRLPQHFGWWPVARAKLDNASVARFSLHLAPPLPRARRPHPVRRRHGAGRQPDAARRAAVAPGRRHHPPVPEALALVLALLVLAGTLAAAVVHSRWPVEALAAAGGAALLVAVGALSVSDARHAIGDLGPTVGFLAALLVLAEGCRREGLFEAMGGLMAAGARGSPRRLLALVFAVAATVTAVLSLDATVVLLTPIVFATAARLRTSPRPHVYACSHLANSASLLLPVSNLTNLLAFHASGLSFMRFAGLMALPTARRRRRGVGRC